MVEEEEACFESKEKTKGAFKIKDEHGKKIYNNTWYQDEKPVEMFRTDLITAMKIPDHQQLTGGEYIKIRDTWRQEYDRGVQVPVDLDCLPPPKFSEIPSEITEEQEWSRPDKYFSWKAEKDVWDEIINGETPHVIYDMDEDDIVFLNELNSSLVDVPKIEEILFESVITHLDSATHISMVRMFQNDTGYSIQYDDTVSCEVCRDVYSEPDNEMVFCDRCNICVHQSCYGILKIPADEWFCSPCSKSFEAPVCLLCMQGGGAFKMTDNNEWVHVFCALWVPECQFGDIEKMEPITKITKIPSSRWSLMCVMCQKRVGACIQCSEKSCKVSYHVTCAFQSSLLMMTEFDTNLKQIKNVSYCPKHSSTFRESSFPKNAIILQNADAHNTLYQEKMCRLNQIKEQFFDYVDKKEVMSLTEFPEHMFDKVFDYWKEKRMKNGNNPLIVLPLLENLAIQMDPLKTFDQIQDKNDLGPMLKLVSLRQDLERARTMCTMVERRERLKKKLLSAAIAVFEEQFDKGESLEFKFSKLGIPDRHLSGSFVDCSMTPSDPSLSKVIFSPTKLDMDDVYTVGNDSLVVAGEIVLNSTMNIENDEVVTSPSEDLSKDKNKNSKEDPEWLDNDKERSRKKRIKKRKSEAKKETKKELVDFTNKVRITFSDKSDCPTSQDEFSHFTTPPTSPEFPISAQTQFTRDNVKSLFAMLEKSPLKRPNDHSPSDNKPSPARLTPKSDKDMSPKSDTCSTGSRKRKDFSDSDNSVKSFSSRTSSPVTLSKQKSLKLKDSNFLDEALSVSPIAKRSKLKNSPR